MGEVLGIGLSHGPHPNLTDESMANVYFRHNLLDSKTSPFWKDPSNWPKELKQDKSGLMTKVSLQHAGIGTNWARPRLSVGQKHIEEVCPRTNFCALSEPADFSPDKNTCLVGNGQSNVDVLFDEQDTLTVIAHLL